MSNTSYKKRDGTSGIQGQLYETKLISLIYFRMLHDNGIKQFSLATNRDDTGAFDDISFKANVKGFDKPLAVFIQAKHRENEKLLMFTSKKDLIKYFVSYLLIRRTFEPSSKDMIFGGKFDETECVFVMYTTAKDDPNNKVYEGDFAEYLNKLIGTGGSCTQPAYTDEDLDFLCKIVMQEHMKVLAEQLAKFICEDSGNEISMNNDLLLNYHVILALNVLDVSEILYSGKPEGHRIASFKQDFFTNNDEYLVLFKNKLCLGVLKKQQSEDTDLQSLLLMFLREPSDVKALSKLLIGRVLKYKNDKLEFVGKSVTDEQKRQLDKANVSPSTVYEAAELATKDYLLSRKLKASAFFGNKDLAIRGNDKSIQKRLNHLTKKIKEILEKSNSDHVVTIDESVDEGFLRLNGGIASAISNILVLDETSKLLKFTDSCESLGKVAKTWYETLNSDIPNLHKYRLDVKVKKFPKLSFERGECDEDLVRDFYNKLVFYTNQADQNRVEEILRKEIEAHPCNDVDNFKDRSGLIYVEYHDKIQKLWMTPKEGSYLTKKSKIYEKAVTYAMSQSLISVIKNMHNNKYQDFTFNDDAIKRLELHGQILGTVIVSKSCVLSVAKVEQYLRNKDYVVIDLESIFKLPLKTHNILCKDLANVTKDKIFIIVCNTVHDSNNFTDRLETIAKAINDGKKIIVITNKISVEIMTKYFPAAKNVWKDERNVFTDLTADSQKKFLATFKIKLQGVEVSLDMIVDDMSVRLIDEDVFYKIVNNETVEIGKKATYSNYEEQLYIDRRVSRIKTQEKHKFDDVKDKVIKTLYDLEDDIVLVTAEQEMGKSTLLTHLSLKTKELDPKAWIVRINLPEYEDVFKNHRIAISTLKSLEFMCQTALSDRSIELEGDDLMEESPDKLFALKKCSGSNSKVFQFKIFLHYYNRGKLIFVIDGFDEMNSEYKICFGTWLKTVKSKSRKHKIWITSSSSSRLEGWFGPSYKLQNFSHLDQEIYLKKLWKHKIQFKSLCTNDLQNIEDFVDYMYRTRNKSEYLRVYKTFLEFLKTERLDVAIDFSYDECYNRFKTRFDLGEDTIPCIRDDATPEDLYKLAENLDINTEEGFDRMFFDMSQGNYADF
ncbi:hypothetical protein PYW07_013352 [Mythimna separata]|uniref:NACHT domain-containing protein n=1 Tax=Mythimna separata TaxID=271217 RepID=A0AAD7Y6B0_MYTSE|nr:hypothetical protein PYW07_013352 [Mythimna separata]